MFFGYMGAVDGMSPGAISDKIKNNLWTSVSFCCDTAVEPDPGPRRPPPTPPHDMEDVCTLGMSSMCKRMACDVWHKEVRRFGVGARGAAVQVSKTHIRKRGDRVTWISATKGAGAWDIYVFSVLTDTFSQTAVAPFNGHDSFLAHPGTWFW